MRGWLGLLIVAGVACPACVEPSMPPAEPAELPEAPGPLPPSPPPPPPQGYLQDAPQGSPVPAPESPSLPRPRPTGDRERDALELGFWGCRVMGVRLAPGMSGRVLLQATLGAAGEVVDVVAQRVENLPRPVVQCLIERAARAHFDPRGGYGSVVEIPVDFTAAGARPAPAVGTASPAQSL